MSQHTSCVALRDLLVLREPTEQQAGTCHSVPASRDGVRASIGSLPDACGRGTAECCGLFIVLETALGRGEGESNCSAKLDLDRLPPRGQLTCCWRVHQAPGTGLETLHRVSPLILTIASTEPIIVTETERLKQVKPGSACYSWCQH